MKKMMKSLMAGLMATGCLIAYGETQTADGPEMYTDMIRLKYADADDVTRMCNNVVNTNLVRFRPDRRCNTIIVTAPKTDLATIKRVIDEMDLRPSQVQLETVFIQVELDDDLQTGADWIERGRQKFFEDGKLNIAAIVQAAKSDSRTKILCTPTLMTLDNKLASIEATETIDCHRSNAVNSGECVRNYEKPLRLLRGRGRIVRRETSPQPVARAEDRGVAREGRTLLGRRDGL